MAWPRAYGAPIGGGLACWAVRATFLLAIAVTALLATCVIDTRPDPEMCAQPSVRVAVTVTPESMTPETVNVCRDQEVTLAVTPEVDGVIHVHGYDEVATREISAGQPTELVFVVDRVGQFTIEIHGETGTGVAVGILTVHER
jgi:hypothetical protein